MFKRPSPV